MSVTISYIVCSLEASICFLSKSHHNEKYVDAIRIFTMVDENQSPLVLLIQFAVIQLLYYVFGTWLICPLFKVF